MGREIRITIDDDEVFERMKARKRELDLSWEDVLHRGLRRSDGQGSAGGVHEYPAGGPGYPSEVARDPIRDPTGFAEDLKRQIQGHVRESLHASLSTDPDLDPLDSQVETLAAAEDAVLGFDFLADAAARRSNQVPLRVTLEASADGLDVDVVAVREGKSVTDMNAFEPETRRQVIEGLASGADATLSLAGDAESYRVRPALTWSRENGIPTVSAVSIEEVRFDGSG